MSFMRRFIVLELFTEEDMLLFNNNSHNRGFAEDAQCINKILNERLEVGHCSLDVNARPNDITVAKFDNNTHKIYYATKPLEPEKVECDHCFASPDGHSTPSYALLDGYNFCPKCGKKLN